MKRGALMLRRTLIWRMTLMTSAAFAMAGIARAADLPATAPSSPAYSWTGFYGGINAGGHWGASTLHFGTTDTSSPVVGGGLGIAQAFGVIPTTGASSESGFIGGGQFGYNFQRDRFVLGLEVDVDGATGRNRSSALLSNNILIFPTLTESAQSLDWLGTVRGRLGWTPADHFLIYATGGFAFGRSAASITSVNIAASNVLDAYVAARRSIGWTVGGGVEYALPGVWSNWSVKVEYLYYDLGRSNSTVFYQNIDLAGAPEFSTLTGTVRHNADIARAGLNYKFNFGASEPVIAKY